MPEGLLALLDSAFPSVDRELLKSFEKNRLKVGSHESDYYSTSLPVELCQGDVVGPLEFFFRADTPGEVETEWLDGMIISRSCDIDNDPEIMVAPCFPPERYKEEKFYSSLPDNRVTRYFYLSKLNTHDAVVVDLPFTQNFSSQTIRDAIAQGTVVKRRGFTDLGYVFMVIKLTLHLFSPPLDEEDRGVSSPQFLSRVRYGASAIWGALRYVANGSQPPV